MKICVISTPIFRLPVSGYAGLEVIAWHCARGLVELGHQVALVAPDGSECPGVQVIPCGPAGQVSEQQAYGGRKWAEKVKNDKGEEVEEQRAYPGYWQHLSAFDCVIDHSWNKYAYLLKQEGVLKAPILGVMHAPANTMFGSPPPVERPCVVCISEDQRRHYEVLFSPHEARVSYNGIDTSIYSPLGVPRTDRYLFLARFSTVKGPDLALEAAIKASVGLDLVGDTTITNEPLLIQHCVDLVDNHNGTMPPDVLRRKRIVVHGNVPRGNTVWWYSQANCLIHSTWAGRFREPFGLAPVESMAGGCPVIGGRFGALPETVVDGETGFLVKSTDEAVAAILKWEATGAGRKETVRRQCRERASLFSIQAMCKRYEELCREALDGGW